MASGPTPGAEHHSLPSSARQAQPPPLQSVRVAVAYEMPIPVAASTASIGIYVNGHGGQEPKVKRLLPVRSDTTTLVAIGDGTELPVLAVATPIQTRIVTCSRAKTSTG